MSKCQVIFEQSLSIDWCARAVHRFSSRCACADCGGVAFSIHRWTVVCCCSDCSWLSGLPVLVSWLRARLVSLQTEQRPLLRLADIPRVFRHGMALAFSHRYCRWFARFWQVRKNSMNLSSYKKTILTRLRHDRCGHRPPPGALRPLPGVHVQKPRNARGLQKWTTNVLFTRDKQYKPR